MSIKRHITPILHNTIGVFDRRVLAALVEKMTEEEALEFYRLLQAKEHEIQNLKQKLKRGFLS
jgi:hypothetical protein